MKNLALKVLPIIIMGVFILLMTSGNYFKKSLTEEDDLIHHIDQVTVNLEEENWEEASREIDKAKEAWTHVMTRIQFSSNKKEMNALKLGLERAAGFIASRNLSSALNELVEIRFIWNEIGR